MAKKLFIRTFGCQMNEYDSDKMADVLAASEEIVKTDTPDDADIILFNTCSVREKAQERVFHDLGRVRLLKLANPDLVIGVGGCVASQEGAAIVARAPYVDVVFGPQTLHRLPQLIAERRRLGKSQVDISFPEIEKFDHLPPARVEGIAAFVSIMEGCSKFCSFCIVPYTRGEEVSRPFDDVLTEVAGLAAQGVREVTLLGQNVNAYRGAMSGSGQAPAGEEAADLALLIEYIAEIPGIERIRYTTSHPREVSPRLIEVYARGAEAGIAPASAGPVGIGSRPRGDETRLYGARIQEPGAQAAGGTPPTCRSPRISSSAFRGRRPRISRKP
jgi:tRNA-2-methylthio-N6-dimethylallyladenosine synthase